MAIRIIVADDSTTVQKVLKLILTPKGYQVECYGSGNDAYDAIRKNKPSIIFADAVMPGMNGIELGMKIQKGHKELQGIPLVLMHSAFDEVSSSDLKISAAQAKLIKPFDDQQVIDLVEKLTKKPVTVVQKSASEKVVKKDEATSTTWNMESFVQPEIPDFDEPLKGVPETDEDGFIKVPEAEDIAELGVPEPHEILELRNAPSFEVQKPMSEESLSENEAQKLLEEFDLSENPDGSIAFKSKPDNKVNMEENIDAEKDMGLWGDRFYAKTDEIEIPEVSSLSGEEKISAANIEFDRSYSISDPASKIHTDEVLQRMTKETIERMLRQMLPDIIEKVVREEISKIIGK